MDLQQRKKSLTRMTDEKANKPLIKFINLKAFDLGGTCWRVQTPPFCPLKEDHISAGTVAGLKGEERRSALEGETINTKT